MNGGFPKSNGQALSRYWAVRPKLRAALLKPRRPSHLDLAIAPAAITPTTHQHAEFQALIAAMNVHFVQWRFAAVAHLKSLDSGNGHPKDPILGTQCLLDHYEQ